MNCYPFTSEFATSNLMTVKVIFAGKKQLKQLQRLHRHFLSAVHIYTCFILYKSCYLYADNCVHSATGINSKKKQKQKHKQKINDGLGSSRDKNDKNASSMTDLKAPAKRMQRFMQHLTT